MRSGAARLALPLLAVLAACGDVGRTGPPTNAPRPLYFDVKGLLNEQVASLNQRRPAITKRVRLRGEALETARVPRVKWADELQLFYQADINKAALRGAYTVDSVALPGGGQRLTYTRRPGQKNAPVARLQVQCDATGAAHELTATVQQQNTLFSTEKHLTLHLPGGQLRTYEVRGAQKLVFFDTLRYVALGQVE